MNAKKLFLALIVLLVAVRAPAWVLTVLLVASVAVAGLTALNLMAVALWPARVERSRQTLERFPLRSFLVGILVLLTEIWLVQSLPAKPLIVLGALGANLVWLAQGLPALAERVGRGSTTAGTALLGLVWGLPVLGWLAGACLGLSALGAPLARQGGDV